VLVGAHHIRIRTGIRRRTWLGGGGRKKGDGPGASHPEASLYQGVPALGLASDDSVKDLRRKIARAGGNAAVLSFDTDDLTRIQAEVFSVHGYCEGSVNIPAPAGERHQPPAGGLHGRLLR